MIKVYKGKPTIEYFRKTDTTVRFSKGGLVELALSGNLVVLSNDSTDHPLGILMKDLPLSDSDDLVPVALADERVIWEMDLDASGGAADSDVGRYCAIDTGDTVNVQNTVDIDDTSPPFFLITQVVSSTKVRGILARTALRTPAGDSLDS